MTITARELTFEIYKRDLTGKRDQPTLTYTVERYSRTIWGGPKAATISVAGDAAEIWQLRRRLRCPVKIRDWTGRVVWHGLIYTVDITDGKDNVSLDIDRMYNNVIAVYPQVDASSNTIGGLTETSAVSDTDSIAEYGTKAYRAPRSPRPAAQATAEAARFLEEHAWPIATWKMSNRAQDATARITCRGWYETLGWEYYSGAALYEANDATGAVEYDVADDDTRLQLAQSFQLSLSMSVDSISIRVKRYGIPAGNLRIKLASDSAGSPGTVLQETSITPTDIPEYDDGFTWYTWTLSPYVALTSGTTYWIIVGRQTGTDPDHYYKVRGTAGDAYASGTVKFYDNTGPGWVAQTYSDQDTKFRITGVVESTTDIENIVAGAGQFFTDTYIKDASGVYGSAYHDGESTARAEIERLLTSGTSNNRRILCDVSEGRVLILTEEPAQGANDYRIIGGELVDAQRNPVATQWCMCGIWARIELPSYVVRDFTADIEYVFIEEAEYDAGSDTTQYKSRNGITAQSINRYAER